MFFVKAIIFDRLLMIISPSNLCYRIEGHYVGLKNYLAILTFHSSYPVHNKDNISHYMGLGHHCEVHLITPIRKRSFPELSKSYFFKITLEAGLEDHKGSKNRKLLKIL